MLVVCFRTTSRRAVLGETDCRGVFNLNIISFYLILFYCSDSIIELSAVKSTDYVFSYL